MEERAYRRRYVGRSRVATPGGPQGEVFQLSSTRFTPVQCLLIKINISPQHPTSEVPGHLMINNTQDIWPLVML